MGLAPQPVLILRSAVKHKPARLQLRHQRIEHIMLEIDDGPGPAPAREVGIQMQRKRGLPVRTFKTRIVRRLDNQPKSQQPVERNALRNVLGRNRNLIKPPGSPSSRDRGHPARIAAPLTPSRSAAHSHPHQTSHRK